MYEEQIWSDYEYEHKYFLQCLKKMNIRCFNINIITSFDFTDIYLLLSAQLKLFTLLLKKNFQKKLNVTQFALFLVLK